MTKIRNQVAYKPDTEINQKDYLIGSDFDTQNKETVNFRVEDLGGHFNMTNGIRNFDYFFYQHNSPSATPSEGYFYSNGNEQNPESITHFILSKKTLRGKDVSQFLQSIIADNPFDLVVSQKRNINSVFYFRIQSIEQFIGYFKLNVSEVFFHENITLEYMESFNSFVLKSAGGTTITNTSELINDGSDGTSTYVETGELGVVAFSNDYNDLDNLPTIPTVPSFADQTETNAGSITDKTISPNTLSGWWSYALTLTSFFNAVRGTVLTGFNNAITWARVTTSSTIQDAISLLQRQSNYLQNTRVISGVGVSMNADPTKFDIQVVGEIVDPNTFTPTPINVNITAISATHITTQVESYVWVNSSATVIQSLTPPTPDLFDSIIGYWVLVHSNLSTISVINSFPFYTDGVGIQLKQVLDYIGFSKYAGTNQISPGTTGTRLTHTGGRVIKAGGGNTTKRPVFELSGATDSFFRMRNQNGSEGSDTQTIDVLNIDIGGVTTALANNNRFGAHKVWKFSSSLIRIQRGQKSYANYDDAIAGINVDPYIDEGNCKRNGIHIGWIVFRRNTSWGAGGTGTAGSDYQFVDVTNGKSSGNFVPTLQAGYNVSSQPQIKTDIVKGAVQFQGGTGVDTDRIFEGKDNAGTVTSWIAADGSSSFGGGIIPKVTTLTSSQLTEQNVKGFVDYANALSPNLVIAANEIYDFVVTDTDMIFKLYKSSVTIGLGQTAITTADVSVNKSYWNNEFLNTYKVISRGDATLTTLGTAAFIATGTAAGVTGGSGLYAEIKQKTGITSTTSTAGSTCGYRDGNQTFFNFSQGFKASFMFANSDAALVADARNFVGFTNSNSVIGNVNPSTLLSIFGLANDSGEANFSIMHNDGSGTATKIPLGANFPANTSKVDVYKVTFETFPNTNRLYWEVKRLNTGHTASGVITTDVNFSSAGFAPQFWHNSGATALAVNQTLFSFISNFYH